ncbi:ISAs1 family transposase [Planctomicrobium sp. SH527]|uniref:ISAs1 family transposase n=1 Tax=Planctomicrobium sp. SH527 TaxID=3448123 RepID=UPI003F5B906B
MICAQLWFCGILLVLDSELIEQGVQAMAREVSVGLDEVVGDFAPLEDPRSSVNRQHPLESVVVIAILAILAGASGPTAIVKWAALKEEFLAQSFNLPFGVPGKDVFRRVLAGLNPEAFQAGFVGWLSALKAAAQTASEVDQPIVAIDGKTARRSHDHRNGLSAMHAVSVWASEWGLSLGQVACAEKSNEITTIPELLKLVDISGAIDHHRCHGNAKGDCRPDCRE